jgi:hypothetical protein
MNISLHPLGHLLSTPGSDGTGAAQRLRGFMWPRRCIRSGKPIRTTPGSFLKIAQTLSSESFQSSAISGTLQCLRLRGTWDDLTIEAQSL